MVNEAIDLPAEGSILPLLTGLVPEFLPAVASPTGTVLSYQPVFRGEWVDVRRAA